MLAVTRLKAAIFLLTRGLIADNRTGSSDIGPNSKYDGWQSSDELTP